MTGVSPWCRSEAESLHSRSTRDNRLIISHRQVKLICSTKWMTKLISSRTIKPNGRIEIIRTRKLLRIRNQSRQSRPLCQNLQGMLLWRVLWLARLSAETCTIANSSHNYAQGASCRRSTKPCKIRTWGDTSTTIETCLQSIPKLVKRKSTRWLTGDHRS